MRRTEPIHAVSDLEDSKPYQPIFVRQGDYDLQMDDYLLITVLPRDSRFDRRMVSLAGLHKPGTLAAGYLLSHQHVALALLSKIDDVVQGVPYYQALIALKVGHTPSKLPFPRDLEFKGAEALKEVVPLRHSTHASDAH